MDARKTSVNVTVGPAYLRHSSERTSRPRGTPTIVDTLTRYSEPLGKFHLGQAKLLADPIKLSPIHFYNAKALKPARPEVLHAQLDTNLLPTKLALSASGPSLRISLKIFATSRPLFAQPGQAVAFGSGGHVSQNQFGVRFLEPKGALLEVTLQLRVRPFLLTLDQCNSRPCFGVVR
jgi:hypothetical protein